jgi:hypothetical protein
VRYCNAQAASLENTTVVWVSMDLPFAQARFCGAEGLDKVIIASDFRSGSFGRAYGNLIVDDGADLGRGRHPSFGSDEDYGRMTARPVILLWCNSSYASAAWSRLL